MTEYLVITHYGESRNVTNVYWPTPDEDDDCECLAGFTCSPEKGTSIEQAQCWIAEQHAACELAAKWVAFLQEGEKGKI